jgi:hypothetical protein
VSLLAPDPSGPEVGNPRALEVVDYEDEHSLNVVLMGDCFGQSSGVSGCVFV